MSITCPNCGAAIAADDVNVAQNVAYCRPCNQPHQLSSFASPYWHKVDLANPPKGVWYFDDGAEVVIGGGTRAWGTGAFFLAFAGLWNFGSWHFLIQAIHRTLHPVSAPAAPGTTHADPEVWIMIPFVLIGLLTACIALFSFFGKTEFRVRSDNGSAFVGVGRVGWCSRFKVSQVQDLTIVWSSWKMQGQDLYQIVLKGTKIRIGSALTDERISFVAGALRKALGLKP